LRCSGRPRRSTGAPPFFLLWGIPFLIVGAYITVGCFFYDAWQRGRTAYGVTAVILGLPYPLAVAVIAAILDLVPNIGAMLAGVLIGIVALSVSLEALIVFLIVIVVYQLIENYILQPTIIGKAAEISGFTVLASVLAFGALFGLIGAIIGVPITAALQIVVEELTAGRRARIAAADAAQLTQ